MRLKYEFTITTVGDEIIAVPIGSTGQFDGVLTINETMKDLIELLAEDRTEEELINAMLEKYNHVSKNDLETKIHEICVGLKNEGILV